MSIFEARDLRSLGLIDTPKSSSNNNSLVASIELAIILFPAINDSSNDIPKPSPYPHKIDAFENLSNENFSLSETLPRKFILIFLFLLLLYFLKVFLYHFHRQLQ